MSSRPLERVGRVRCEYCLNNSSAVFPPRAQRFQEPEHQEEVGEGGEGEVARDSLGLQRHSERRKKKCRQMESISEPPLLCGDTTTA